MRPVLTKVEQSWLPYKALNDPHERQATRTFARSPWDSSLKPSTICGLRTGSIAIALALDGGSSFFLLDHSNTLIASKLNTSKQYVHTSAISLDQDKDSY